MRCSTTTARCGARSRCRSSSTSSCAGWPRWPRPTPPCATGSRGRLPTSATTAGWPRSWPSTTPATTRTCRAGRRHPGGVREHQRRRVRGALRVVPARRPASDAGARLPRLRLRPDGRAARLPDGQRLHQLHRLRRRPRLHATHQRRGLRRSPGAGDRQCRRSRLRTGRARGDHHQAAGRGLPRRWPGEAGAHLDPHRTAAGARRRQLQRRHRDARLHPAPGQAVPATLVLHDDAEREFDYVSGPSVRSIARPASGWTVVSIKDDWATSSDGQASLAPRPAAGLPVSATRLLRPVARQLQAPAVPRRCQ